MSLRPDHRDSANWQQKKMKKRIPFLLTIGLTFGLAACGPADSSSSSMPPAGTGSPESSEKSSTPSSSPVVKIPKEEFLEAQAKLQSLSGYSYRDSLSVKVDTSLSDQYDPSGVKEGTINFSKTASVTQLAHYQVSGALFFDGESYEIVQDKTKRTVDLNEDGSLKKVNEEAVEGADIPVLAKALFEYDEADIKENRISISSPVARSLIGKYEGDEVTVNDGNIGEVTQRLYDTLTGIQWGVLPDEKGWIVKV